jgi:calcium/calmodulin-dependent protein kinase I
MRKLVVAFIKKDIVHRDLKPENLLYQDPGENSAILVADFGLAKVVGTDSLLNTTCGTPSYIAPEILREIGHGKPVDLWSTGVITYVLLVNYF